MITIDKVSKIIRSEKDIDIAFPSFLHRWDIIDMKPLI